jgi:hypothetical protein
VGLVGLLRPGDEIGPQVGEARDRQSGCGVDVDDVADTGRGGDDARQQPRDVVGDGITSVGAGLGVELGSQTRTSPYELTSCRRSSSWSALPARAHHRARPLVFSRKVRASGASASWPPSSPGVAGERR